jgi:DNA-3-methyladenine glycosylase I
LRKRENFRNAFDRFDPELIARYDEKKVVGLLSDPGIIRNRLKIQAAIINAQAFLRMQDEFGSFHEPMWDFVGGRPKKNAWRSWKEIPATTPESDALSKFLIKRGFKFVGSTICYAHMQAIGMVNDHTIDCFRYDQV